MTHLISTGLQNKKDILFGNMEEIYHFHNRLGLCLGVWRPRLPELCWGRAFPVVKGDEQTGSRLGWDKPRADPEWQGLTKGPHANRAKPVLVRDGHRAHSFLPIPPRGSASGLCVALGRRGQSFRGRSPSAVSGTRRKMNSGCRGNQMGAEACGPEEGCHAQVPPACLRTGPWPWDPAPSPLMPGALELLSDHLLLPLSIASITCCL